MSLISKEENTKDKAKSVLSYPGVLQGHFWLNSPKSGAHYLYITYATTD